MPPELIHSWTNDYVDFLRDESRRVGEAESISFPTSEAEVVEVVKEVCGAGGSITTQGAKTGIAAGAVPLSGHIMNLSRMNAVGEVIPGPESHEAHIVVQPGAILSEVHKVVEKAGFFFPPDPTETSASIGGMVACNASGAMSFFYGSTRKWVNALRIVLAYGEVVTPRRGEDIYRGRGYGFLTEEGNALIGELPSYQMPKVKSAAGYYVDDDMEDIDIMIGMEGTLGIVTEIELRLIRAPKAIFALTVFLPSEESALKFVRFLREDLERKPVAIEFFNHNALDLLRKMKASYEAFKEIPALKPEFHTAIYTEFHAKSEDALEDTIMEIMEKMVELGASDEEAWCATSESELERLKAFRHAVPEAVNLLIDERKRVSPDLTKLGTDMSVPDSCLEAVMEMYNTDLAASGLDSVIFGHIGDNHVHVNILPNSADEFQKGKELYLAWAKRVVKMGGSVSAEHGIGKLKTQFLKLMYGDEAVGEMRELKRRFDPGMCLNPGNLFEV